MLMKRSRRTIGSAEQEVQQSHSQSPEQRPRRPSRSRSQKRGSSGIQKKRRSRSKERKRSRSRTRRRRSRSRSRNKRHKQSHKKERAQSVSSSRSPARKKLPVKKAHLERRGSSPFHFAEHKSFESVEKWAHPKNSPHVHQVLSNPDYVPLDIPFTRKLPEDAARERYRRRKNETKTVIHWGQRKLLLSEIEFLTLCGSCENPVVYAGAAPGTHLTKLAEMFPHHTFHCYDPAPFNVKDLSNLHTYQTLFTDELAMAYRGKDILFICDIRAAESRAEAANDVEESVSNDMDDQQRWFALMQPVAAMLKFRLSWKPGKTQYMDGTILLPVFGPITTTESRLLVIGNSLLAIPNHRLARKRIERSASSSTASQDISSANAEDEIDENQGTIVLREGGFMMQIRDYDNTAYEEQMFYFNTRQRVALYPHFVEGEGLDHCYDCSAEVHILSEYCVQVLGMPCTTKMEQAEVASCVASMSRTISRSLTGERRTLLDGNSDPLLRTTGIHDRQWINNKPAYQEAHAIRAKQLASGNAPRLLVDGSKGDISATTAHPVPMNNLITSDADALTLNKGVIEPEPAHKASGTTISHPLVDRIRMLLQRKSTTFKLPKGLVFSERQKKPSSSGWVRCVASDGTVIYVDDVKELCTTEPPAVSGWIVRAGNAARLSDDKDLKTSYWENTLTGEISVDVPEPLTD